MEAQEKEIRKPLGLAFCMYIPFYRAYTMVLDKADAAERQSWANWPLALDP
jgi:hypothetical protein